ncbi:hypothetical protein GCM10022407_05460 [Hymenobacter antarcticus]|uniref:Uncharacterized protein n=1 Tax=Hymenobacter antarcticus TaxID=486270 RepID=A0ABP7P8F1_9BACT
MAVGGAWDERDTLQRFPTWCTVFKGIKNEELKVKKLSVNFLIFNSSFLIVFRKAETALARTDRPGAGLSEDVARDYC